MELEKILYSAVEQGASDIFFIAGFPLSMKINGTIIKQGEDKLSSEATESYARETFRYRYGEEAEFDMNYQADFSFSIKGVGRFRVNLFYQRGSIAAVLRVVRFEILDYKASGITEEVMDLASVNEGLVLITGTAGSGKSTTLACIIDRINHDYAKHVITIEDPIEYLHRHDMSIVSQREISSDAATYEDALHAALREAPDVILVGEMRSLDTISSVMSAVETGHVVYSTLHTIGASDTINRIIDVYPVDQQHQIELQLAANLKAVVSQKLIKTKKGNLVPAFEVMKVNKAIKNLIRESKVYQIDNYIAGGKSEGMISLDDYIYRLYKDGIISENVAIKSAKDPKRLKQKIKG